MIRHRRLASAAVAFAVTAGLVPGAPVAAAGTASASSAASVAPGHPDTVLDAAVGVEAQATQADYDHVGTCSTGPKNTAGEAITADGRLHTVSAAASADPTDSADPDYHPELEAHISAALRVTAGGGRLRRLDFASHVGGSLEGGAPAPGEPASKCQRALYLTAYGRAYVDVRLAQATRVESTVTGRSPGVIASLNISDNSPAGEPVSVGPDGARTLPKGSYFFDVQIQSQPSRTQVASGSWSADAQIAIHVDLLPAGSASTRSRGTARPYVVLGERRACTGRSLEARFGRLAGTGSARTVRRAVFRVDGRVVEALLRPAAHRTVRLHDLDPSRAAAVVVRLELTDGRVLRLQRSYYRCEDPPDR